MSLIFSDGTEVNSGANVIDRGSTTTALMLDNYNDIHYYYGTSNNSPGLRLPSDVVENAVYEVMWKDRSSNTTNFDPRIVVNNTFYSNQFFMTYTRAPGGLSGGFAYNTTTWQGYYFDHYGGGTGTDGTGRWILTTQRNYKICIYMGGDMGGSVVHGTGRWNNTSTVFSQIGRIDGMPNGTFIDVWVKRIG